MPPPVRAGVEVAGTRNVLLRELAFGRSGDKGNSANIGIAARSAGAWEVIREALTAEVVARVFHKECRGPVRRYELPGLMALNFVLEDALGGGGIVSLRSDPQGKLFAQRLLAQEIEVP